MSQEGHPVTWYHESCWEKGKTEEGVRSWFHPVTGLPFLPCSDMNKHRRHPELGLKQGPSILSSSLSSPRALDMGRQEHEGYGDPGTEGSPTRGPRGPSSLTEWPTEAKEALGGAVLMLLPPSPRSGCELCGLWGKGARGSSVKLGKVQCDLRESLVLCGPLSSAACKNVPGQYLQSQM